MGAYSYAKEVSHIFFDFAEIFECGQKNYAVSLKQQSQSNFCMTSLCFKGIVFQKYVQTYISELFEYRLVGYI